MLVLRLAALLQATFLPGYLLLAAAGVRSRSTVQTLVRAFAASLIVNWLLVYSLTAVGLHRPLVLYAIFVVELGWLLWLQRGRSVPTELLAGWSDAVRGSTLGFQLALGAALATVALFAGYVALNVDAVFFEWDAVVSWNRWALDWAANRFPRTTWHYPQLVPASWSILYVFTGDTQVQAQARMVQALYPLGIALVFLDAGLRRRSARVLLAAPIYAALVHAQASAWHVLPDILSGGWVDIPVSYFGLLAVATVLFAEERTTETWWLALLFGCGAALTKQAGFLVLAYVWVWALVVLEDRRFAVRSLLLVLALVGSWYVAKEIQIRLGFDDSEVGVVTVGVHAGRGALERLRFAGELLGGMRVLGATGVWGLLAALALLALSLRDAVLRPLVLGLVLPLLVIWAFLYSYDTRNASLVVPMLALAFAHALPARAVPWVPTRLQALGGVGVLAAVAALAYDEQAAVASQVAQQRRIDQPELNAALYQYFEENPIRGKVLTGYQIFGFLPGFHGQMIVKAGIMSLADLDGAEANPEIAYVLEPPNWMSGEARWAMEQRIRAGRYRHVFHVSTTYGPMRMVELRP
jgi:hypothetical protein